MRGRNQQKNMLDRLFEYYLSKGDYELAKDSLLRSLEFAREQYYIELKNGKIPENLGLEIN